MMMSPATTEAPAPIEQAHPFGHLVICKSPQTQYCDLFSRLGFSDPADAAVPGLGQGHLASQREGKVFLEPLIAFSVHDEGRGRWVFAGLPAGAERSMVWYPWGCVVEQAEEGLRIRVTAVFADTDVLALRAEVINEGGDARRLRLSARSQPVGSDTDLVARTEPGGEFSLMEQTSGPSSRMQIRREPSFRILTAYHRLFEGEAVPDGRGMAFATPSFELGGGEVRAFDLRISSVTRDLPEGGRLDAADEGEAVAALKSRLGRPAGDVSADIERAIGRWEERLKGIPVEDVEPEYRPLIHQAAVVLMKNSIRPQPGQGYGGGMGGHLGTFPARSGYEGFWIWDSAIHVWGFRHFHPELARENIRIMLHHQRDDGGLCMLHPDSKCASTQPPLFADAAMRIHEMEKGSDPGPGLAFLEEVYSSLCRWNDWWFSSCDPDGNGLAAWPDNLSSGWDDSPRWDTDIPAGPRQNHGAAQYEAVDLNSFLVVDLRRLAEMADLLRRPEEARRLRERASRLGQRIVDELYCPEDNLFYDLNRETRQWNRILTPACFMPLWAGVPLDPEKIRSMLQDVLLNERHFFGPYPFPSVAYSESRYEAGGETGYWRGPVWLGQAWFMLATLQRHRDLLDSDSQGKIERARQNILRMVLNSGIHENYNSQTGGVGALSREHQSWTAAALMEIAKRQYP